jgi:cytochrome c-type biogenesis protein
MDKGKNIFLKLSNKSIYLGAFFLGILFSIGWAPCAMSLMMPVFILTLSQKISIIMGGLLLFVFGLGHGVPIIPLCAVTSSTRGKLGNKYVTAGKWMQRVFGLIIIVIGVIMALRFWGINLW